jgi:hypothetical protein
MPSLHHWALFLAMPTWLVAPFLAKAEEARGFASFIGYMSHRYEPNVACYSAETYKHSDC